MASIYILLMVSLCVVVCNAASLHGTEKRGVVSRGENHHIWAYNLLPEEIGPQHWAEKFNSSCGGKHQSPIDIHASEAVYNAKLCKISINNSLPQEGSTMQLFNNGHSAQVNIVNGDVRLTSSDLGDKYKVEQFHFHWGSDDTQGSEHLLDGNSYPLEMHIVTFDSDRFKNVGEAASTIPDGLAVFSVLYEVTEQDNDDLHPLTDALDNMKEPDAGNKATIPWIDLATLLPSTSLDKFYRYPGSLTTPMCMESVIWTVFAERQKISEAQLDKFRSLVEGEEEGESHKLVNNRRPPQPLNDRIVQKSCKELTEN